MFTKKTTGVFILSSIGLVFILDAFFLAFGHHATISEWITTSIHINWLFAFGAGVFIGGLVYHWLFTNYK
jgi:hypothetical protein